MYTTTDDGQTARGRGVMAKAKAGKHGKTRGRVAGSKNKKMPSWATEHAALSARADIGCIERWAKRIGVERIDEADKTRRETMSFAMLAIRDREIGAGGIVTAEAAVCQMEHVALDPLHRAGVLDDPRDPERSRKRVEAGVELVRLGLDGKVLRPSTAAWRAVGGSSGGHVSEADAESYSALCEMKYLRALDCVGDELKSMIRSVCVDGIVPQGTRRKQLCLALDLLAEHLFHIELPEGTERPRLKFRDRTIPSWLKSR